MYIALYLLINPQELCYCCGTMLTNTVFVRALYKHISRCKYYGFLVHTYTNTKRLELKGENISTMHTLTHPSSWLSFFCIKLTEVRLLSKLDTALSSRCDYHRSWTHRLIRNSALNFYIHDYGQFFPVTNILLCVIFFFLDL